MRTLSLNFQRKIYTNKPVKAINMNWVFDDARKQLVELYSIHPGHLKPKTLVISFNAIILQLLIIVAIVFRFPAVQINILAAQRDAKNQ